MTATPPSRVPEAGPDFPLTGDAREDEETLRDEIQHTREDVEATVDELTDRAVSAARTSAKPLIVLIAVVVAAVVATFAARRWRR